VTVQLYLGDCLDVMATLDTDSVDSIVTDPPYGLEFMGKEWDRLWDKRAGNPDAHPTGKAWSEANGCAAGNKGYAGMTRNPNAYVGGRAAQDWHYRWAVAALRVAKPGAHLLAFGGTRTHHRLMCAIEDAGWEIRDVVMWVYGSGFPKSLDASKAIDKAAGAEREVVGRRNPHRDGGIRSRHSAATGETYGDYKQMDVVAGCVPITAPATPDALRWQGWGTALKPAWEPIIVARKPLVGTVAANVLEYGTGAINIDGCRVDAPDGIDGGRNFEASPLLAGRSGNRIYGAATIRTYTPGIGRWPANLIHDGSDEVLAGFPETGASKSTPRNNGAFKSPAKGYETPHVTGGHDDNGGSAARFFYCPKASKADRDEGCEEMPIATKRIYGDGIPSAVNSDPRGMSGGGDRPARNNHPTVKPTALMRYLCRLATPPGGVVLDPFMGSGSTGKAATLEGFGFIGIEIDSTYYAIAERRIREAQMQPALEGIK
jgi:DNA modification methylase